MEQKINCKLAQILIFYWPLLSAFHLLTTRRKTGQRLRGRCSNTAWRAAVALSLGLTRSVFGERIYH